MSNSVSTLYKSENSASSPFGEDSQIWHDLKQAITMSSGFHRWKQEQTVDSEHLNLNLDQQVCSYLRETLETLAY